MTQIRVLVVEDSPTTRDYVVQLIESEPGLRVVETAGDGAEAIEKTVRLKPDVILMDVHMPHLDGLTATRRIMEQAPTPIVLMSASLERAEVALTFETLDAGAVTIVRKPPGLGDPRQAEAVRELLETLRLMAEVKVVRRWPPRKPAPRAGPGGGDPVRVIAMGPPRADRRSWPRSCATCRATSAPPSSWSSTSPRGSPRASSSGWWARRP